MDFEEIVGARYATKKFDGKKVDEKTMERLLDLIRLAPSSYNLQPWKIRVVTDAALKEKLQAASYNQPQITSCSHVLIFCADTEVRGRIEKLEQAMKKAGIPAENVERLHGMLMPFEAQLQGEKRLAWTQRQAYLALGNALNGAKALGLDSCPMEGFDPAAYAALLQLPKNLVPTVVCPVGYAADKPMPKVRLAKEDVFF